MRFPMFRLLGAGTLLALACSVGLGSDWTSWRGPAHNGVSPETNLPATWSDEKGQEKDFV